MASIRLEDEARQDPRFKVLGKRLGTTKFDARARMEELWAYCTEKQTYYLSEEIIDALAEFEGFHQIICDPAVDLAEKTDQGVRIKGTAGRIEWLGKLRENGKKGGRPKEADPTETPQVNNQEETKEEPEGNQEVTNSEPTPNPLILIPVLSLTNKKQEEEIQGNAVGLKPPAEQEDLPIPKKSKFSHTTRQKMREFIVAYAEAYKGKYHHPPQGIGDKALIGKLGHWIERISIERARSLVQVYLQISYRPFDESYHDLWNFFRHQNRIGIALDSGHDPNQTDWSKVFGRAL